MFSRILRIAAVLLLASSIVSCISVAPPAPGPLSVSPFPTDAGVTDTAVPAPPTALAGDLAPTVADPVAAEAVLVFSQPPNPDGGLIPTSFHDADGSASGQ